MECPNPVTTYPNLLPISPAPLYPRGNKSSGIGINDLNLQKNMQIKYSYQFFFRLHYPTNRKQHDSVDLQ